MTPIIQKTKDATFNKQNSSNFQIESKIIYANDSNLNNTTNLCFNQEIKLIPAQNNINFYIPYYLTRQFILNSFRDQGKTLLLQRIIRVANFEMIDYIIKELKGCYKDIIRDKNGNYFFSDLIRVCEINHRILILEELSPLISELCLNNFATFSIQTLIERASSEVEYKYILNSFYDYNKFLTASLDSNGSYTVQKIIERIPNRFRNDFNYIFISFIEFTSKTKFGIITVKKFISYTKDENTISQIMNFIRNNFMNFAVGQYSNYLIQFLLEKLKNTPEENEIKKLIFENFHEMSKKKYSSFICETFIRNISKEEKKKIIDTLDWNYILQTNNRHLVKIVKALGVYYNENNNIMFPLNLNKNLIKYNSI